ncbi:lipase/esterase [Histoplasma ohiense]|nr:lipase/esterase [Histoplasma ohiense (nom. inval.)]
MSPNPTILFHGKDVPLELPAGVATSSSFGDIAVSLPSTSRNVHLDYPTPIRDMSQEFKPMPFPDDADWPSSQPRAELYANADILTHPFVSPLSGPKEIWKDAPPIFITIGEELTEDGGTYLAKKVHEAGGTAVLERFDSMPHCFALIFGDSAAAKRCYRGWADFCLDAVHGRVKRTRQALYIHRDGRGTVTKDLSEIGSLSLDEVQRLHICMYIYIGDPTSAE